MGDLTKALVDLGAAAERRRSARSDLREAIPTIVSELLRHLRAGDTFNLYVPSGSDYPDHLAQYRVERVTWSGTAEIPLHPDRLDPQPETRLHPKGAATLVRWPMKEDGDGAALLDPRESWSVTEWDGLGECDVELTFEPDRSPTGLKVRDVVGRFPHDDVHVATDDELIMFAEEAEQVIRGFAEQFARDADSMKQAVTSTSKFGPR